MNHISPLRSVYLLDLLEDPATTKGHVSFSLSHPFLACIIEIVSLFLMSASLVFAKHVPTIHTSKNNPIKEGLYKCDTKSKTAWLTSVYSIHQKKWLKALAKCLKWKMELRQVVFHKSATKTETDCLT